MRKLTPRERNLLLLVVALALIGIFYGRGSGLGGGAAGDEALDLKDFGEPPVVLLTHLGLEPEGYDPEGRNLFAYYTPPPPPRPVVERAPVERPKPQPVVPQPRPSAPVVTTPQKPVAPRPTFRYIGFLGPKDNKIAVLQKGEEVILAALGDVVDERFTIAGFEYEMLIVGYTDERFRDETTELPMKR